MTISPISPNKVLEMTQSKRPNGITTMNNARYVFAVLLTLLLVAGLGTICGCQDTSIAHDSAPQPPANHASDHSGDHSGDHESDHESDHADSHPVATAAAETQDKTAAEQEPESGVLGKAGELLKKATAQGGQTAKGAGQWVQEQLGGAADAGGKTAEETWAWANETFEMLKAKGLTTASNTSEWLGQDWSNMESWEYKIVTLGDTDEGLTNTLNELGKLGWECFETETRLDGTRFFFKKPTFSYLRQMPFKDLIKLAPLMNNGEK
jgi:hypothetical protein